MKLPACPGVAATVRINGVDLPECEADDEEPENGTTALSYIEAISGHEFEVRVCMGSKFKYYRDAIVADVYLDGAFAVGTVASPRANHDRKNLYMNSVKRQIKGAWVSQQFQFADLATTDDVSRVPDYASLKELGTIRVAIVRARELDNRPTTTGASFQATTADVPEKGLKGRAISTRALGKAVPTIAGTTTSLTYPYGKTPVATFEFKYRSHKDLQIEGIIPRSPSPVPLEDRDPDELNLEEARELLRRQREQAEVKQEIKQEKRGHAMVIEDDGTDDDEVTVSFEGDRRKRLRTSHDPGTETIDLTGD